METAIVIILNIVFVGIIIHSSFKRRFKAGCDYTEKMNKNVNSTLQNKENSK